MSEDPRAEAVAALWARGRESWPALALDGARFADWLLPRLEPGQDPSRLMAADLYLAAACLLDVPGAAAAFVERYHAESERHARRVAGDTEAAELAQDVAVRVLLPGPDGSPPRLSQYTGRGPLGVWLRMTLVRRALNTTRTSGRHMPLEDAPELARSHDVERSVVRRRYRKEMGEIFREAAALMTRDERTLLRLHYLDGVTLDELATLYRTSRSTVHRRVEAARAAVMSQISALTAARLGIAPDDRASLIRVFQSDLRETLAFVVRDT